MRYALRTLRAHLILLSASACLLFGLSGCATTAERQAYLDEFRSHGISSELSGKIEHRERLELEDLAELGRKSVPDSLVIDYVERTRAIYRLTTKDIDYLRHAKLSEAVIDYLLQTPENYYRQRALLEDTRGPLYGYSPYYGYPYYYPYPLFHGFRMHREGGHSHD